MRKGRIKWCISETGGLSMRQASKISGVSYPAFRKWAKIYDLWCPNQSGKGISKKKRFLGKLDHIYIQTR
jgi:transposase